MRTLPRRRLFAVLAAAPAAGLPSTARAFRAEPAGAALRAEYGETAAACDASAAHDQLRAELARLAPPGSTAAGRPLPEALLREIEGLSRCPFCGCSVLGAEDHGEGRQASPD
jgi:hypothetical protein